jgi:hypothetical protein
MSGNEKPKASAVLRKLLAGTREEEIDCDRFLEELAPILDGRIEDPDVREKLEHHMQQCLECSEEFEMVKRALER